jgi:hypothetical protein
VLEWIASQSSDQSLLSLQLRLQLQLSSQQQLRSQQQHSAD